MAFLKDIKKNPAYKKQLNGLLPDRAADKLEVVDFDVEPSEEVDEAEIGGDQVAPSPREEETEQPSEKTLKKRKAIRDVLAGLKASE